MKEGERGLSVTKPIGTVKNEHTRRGKSQGPLVTGYRLQRNRFHAHDATCNKCSKRIEVGEGQNKGARGKKERIVGRNSQNAPSMRFVPCLSARNSTIFRQTSLTERVEDTPIPKIYSLNYFHRFNVI